MAYLRGYNHDVFVSYSLTNDKLRLDDQPWVTTLVELLKIQLENRLGSGGKEVKEYFAGTGSLRTGDQLSDCLAQASRSAVFLMIGSPRYLDEWPISELGAFGEAASGARDRIFIAEMLPLAEGAYPADIGNPKRAEFWELTRNKVAVSFERSQGVCNERVAELADAMAVRLKAMRARESLPTRDREPDPSRRKVLLARTTDDLREQSNRLRTYLESFDIAVLPYKDDPFEETGAAFRARYNQILHEKPIVVQLLGPHPALRTTEFPEGYDAFQASAAEARRDVGVDLIQWRDPFLLLHEVKDQAHRKLLDKCGDQIADFEEFRAYVLGETKPKSSPVGPNSHWFIDADSTDVDILNEVMEYCRENKIRALRPMHGVDQPKSWRINYTKAQAIALIHSQSNSDWLSIRQSLFMDTSARPSAAQHLVLYLGGPPEKDKKKCVTISHEGLEVIPAPTGDLKPLLRRLT